MPRPRDDLGDLVEDSRLDATLLPGGRDTRQGGRPRAGVEIWRRTRELGGAGGGRRVWLESCVSGRQGEVRVLKEIRKPAVATAATEGSSRQNMAHRQELYAMAKFSQPKVGLPAGLVGTRAPDLAADGVQYAHCFVTSYGWFETEDMICIAMEYLEHGDLQRWLADPFPESEALAITSQLLDGLSFMHEGGFAHRDLKPPVWPLRPLSNARR